MNVQESVGKADLVYKANGVRRLAILGSVPRDDLVRKATSIRSRVRPEHGLSFQHEFAT